MTSACFDRLRNNSHKQAFLRMKTWRQFRPLLCDSVLGKDGLSFQNILGRSGVVLRFSC